MSGIISVIVAVFKFIMDLIIDLFCIIILLISFVAFWRVPFLFFEWSCSDRNDFRGSCAAAFGRAILDIVTLVCGLITFCSWRCVRVVLVIISDWDFRASEYNLHLRWEVLEQFGRWVIDIPFVLMILFNHVTLWRIPFFYIAAYHEAHVHGIALLESEPVVYDDWREVFFMQFVNAFLDLLLLPIVLIVFLTGYRIPLVLREWKEIEGVPYAAALPPTSAPIVVASAPVQEDHPPENNQEAAQGNDMPGSPPKAEGSVAPPLQASGSLAPAGNEQDVEAVPSNNAAGSVPKDNGPVTPQLQAVVPASSPPPISATESSEIILKKKGVLALHALLVLVDIPFGIMIVLTFLMGFHAKALLEDLSTEDDWYERRHIMVLHFLYSFRDVLCVPPFLVTLLVVYRGYFVVKLLVDRVSRWADPKPVLDVSAVVPQLPPDRTTGLLLSVMATKPADFCLPPGTPVQLYIRNPDDFWSRVRIAFGSAAASIGELLLPYKLTPRFVDVEQIKAGTTDASITIDFAISQPTANIMRQLKKFGPDDKAVIQVEYGSHSGTLFNVEVSLALLEHYAKHRRVAARP